jgi:hypothetical protein
MSCQAHIGIPFRLTWKISETTRKAFREEEVKVNGIARVSLVTSLRSVQASIYTIHSTTYYNFADVLYGCDTWSLILREELRLRVF